jgi:hypothetical protein
MAGSKYLIPEWDDTEEDKPPSLGDSDAIAPVCNVVSSSAMSATGVRVLNFCVKLNLFEVDSVRVGAIGAWSPWIRGPAGTWWRLIVYPHGTLTHRGSTCVFVECATSDTVECGASSVKIGVQYFHEDGSPACKVLSAAEHVFTS